MIRGLYSETWVYVPHDTRRNIIVCKVLTLIVYVVRDRKYVA